MLYCRIHHSLTHNLEELCGKSEYLVDKSSTLAYLQCFTIREWNFLINENGKRENVYLYKVALV